MLAVKRTVSRMWRTQYEGSTTSARTGLPVTVEIMLSRGKW